MVLVARRYGKTKILEVVFPQSRYKVDFAFLTHAGRSNANQLRALLEQAAQSKNPFHCIAVETPGRRGYTQEFEQSINEDIKKFQQQWIGKTTQQIAQMEENLFHTIRSRLVQRGWEYPDFNAQLLTLCYRYGSYTKAAELYDPKEFETVKKIQDKYNKTLAEQTEMVNSLKRNPDHPNKIGLEKNLKEKTIQLLQTTAEYVSYRNDYIRRTVTELQEDLQKEYPELKNQKPLRVLCVAVSTHEKLFEDAAIENYRAFEAKKHIFESKTFETYNQLVKQLVRFPNLKIPSATLEKIVSEFLQ